MSVNTTCTPGLNTHTRADDPCAGAWPTYIFSTGEIDAAPGSEARDTLRRATNQPLRIPVHRVEQLVRSFTEGRLQVLDDHPSSEDRGTATQRFVIGHIHRVDVRHATTLAGRVDWTDANFYVHVDPRYTGHVEKAGKFSFESYPSTANGCLPLEICPTPTPLYPTLISRMLAAPIRCSAPETAAPAETASESVAVADVAETGDAAPIIAEDAVADISEKTADTPTPTDNSDDIPEKTANAPATVDEGIDVSEKTDAVPADDMVVEPADSGVVDAPAADVPAPADHPSEPDIIMGDTATSAPASDAPVSAPVVPVTPAAPVSVPATPATPAVPATPVSPPASTTGDASEKYEARLAEIEAKNARALEELQAATDAKFRKTARTQAQRIIEAEYANVAEFTRDDKTPSDNVAFDHVAKRIRKAMENHDDPGAWVPLVRDASALYAKWKAVAPAPAPAEAAEVAESVVPEPTVPASTGEVMRASKKQQRATAAPSTVFSFGLTGPTGK